MLKKHGFLRVGAIVNQTKLSDVFYNIDEIKRLLDLAIEKGVEIVTFPELSVTGYTCQDLFLNRDLLENTLAGLELFRNIVRPIPLFSLWGLQSRYRIPYIIVQ